MLDLRLAKGISYSFVEKVAVSLIGIFQLVVAVRFIPSADLGRLAIVQSLIGFVALFSGSNLGNSLLHHQESDVRVLGSLFRIQISIGIGLYLLTVLLSIPFSLFYNEPALSQIVPFMGLSFLLSSLSSMNSALWYKEMKFRELSLVTVFSAVVGFSATVFLLVNGYGLWAIVWGGLLRMGLASILLLYFGPLSISAIFLSAKNISVRHHLKFSGFQTADSLLIFFSTQLDIFVIGKMLGPETVGQYDIIKRLLQKPIRLLNPMVTRVFLPIMAKAYPLKFKLRELYVNQMGIILGLNLPFFVLSSFYAPEIIHLVLGETYCTPSLILSFRIFCAYFMVYAVQNPLGTLIVSSGKVKSSLLYNLKIALFLPVLLLIVSLKGSLVYIVFTMFIFQFFMIQVAFFWLVKPSIEIGWMAYMKVLLFPLTLAMLAFSISKLVNSIFDVSANDSLFLGLALGGGGYFLLHVAFGSSLYFLLKTYWKQSKFS